MHQVGQNVIIYAISKSDQPVAKGIIHSTNLDTILGGKPLGRQYCKVMITCVMKRHAVLPRPYGNIETMADAHKLSIAWPYERVMISTLSSLCFEL